MEKSEAEAFMRRQTWLAGTSVDFQDQVLARCDLIRFKSGGSVYEAGDEAGGLFGVVSGRIELHLPAHSAGPTLSYIGGPGFWAGDTAAVTGQPRLITIVAGADCELLRLTRAELQRLAAKDPLVWRYVLTLVASNYAKAIRVVDALKRTDPIHRVAAILLVLYEDLPAGINVIEASQSDIAALSQLGRSVVNAALRQMQAEGVILRGYGSIEVTDAAKLGALVGAKKSRSAPRPSRRRSELSPRGANVVWRFSRD